jgi:hypothetical protein
LTDRIVSLIYVRAYISRSTILIELTEMIFR